VLGGDPGLLRFVWWSRCEEINHVKIPPEGSKAASTRLAEMSVLGGAKTFNSNRATCSDPPSCICQAKVRNAEY